MIRRRYPRRRLTALVSARGPVTARCAVRAIPEVTVLTTETAEALLAVAGEVTDRMFD
jgi:hypothetical protein